MPTVVLFDIDGTILNTGGAGRRAFERAFVDLCGSEAARPRFSFAGMTDKAIARRGAEEAGLAPTAELLEALVAAYLERLHDELARTQGYVVYPAVRDLAESLGARPEVAVGLGTGNVRAGAAAKLRHGGLWELYRFGGFGCDAEDRAALLEAGAVRGAALLGAPRSACRVVVVGDTVKDVDAALAIGAVCIGVGTGGRPLGELAERGAHHTFGDLAEPGALEAILG